MQNFVGFLILIALLSQCTGGSSDSKVLTYEQLVAYPSSCAKATEQLKELGNIQRIKNFPADPDDMNDADRLYNGRLKATIWWYAYTCE